MADAKPVYTPVPARRQAAARRGGRRCAGASSPYAQVVGKVMCLAGCTRPDIVQPVAALAHYMAAPRDSHWRAAIVQPVAAALPARLRRARRAVQRPAARGNKRQRSRGAARRGLRRRQLRGVQGHTSQHDRSALPHERRSGVVVQHAAAHRSAVHPRGQVHGVRSCNEKGTVASQAAPRLAACH